MSYEPTEWKAGDTITSAKLNKIEQGIAAGGTGDGSSNVEIANIVWDDEKDGYVFEKSLAELYQIHQAGKLIITASSDGQLCNSFVNVGSFAPIGGEPMYVAFFTPIFSVNGEETLSVTDLRYNQSTGVISVFYYSCALTPEEYNELGK